MTVTAETVGLYAETLVRQVAAGGVLLDYSPESLATLDGLFSGSESAFAASSHSAEGLIVFYAGCYLGEVLVRSLGASWNLAGNWIDSEIVVSAGARVVVVRPFEKVQRRIHEGPEANSLRAYFLGLEEARANASCQGGNLD